MKLVMELEKLKGTLVDTRILKTSLDYVWACDAKRFSRVIRRWNVMLYDNCWSNILFIDDC